MSNVAIMKTAGASTTHTISQTVHALVPARCLRSLPAFKVLSRFGQCECDCDCEYEYQCECDVNVGEYEYERDALMKAP